MSGITVPAGFKHMVRKEKQETEDYKPIIRSFILKTGSRTRITTADFVELLGTTSATGHIKKLMKQGFITRHILKSGRGKSFAYKWHDEPLDAREAALKNGYGITTMLDLPELPIDELTLERLSKLFLRWIDEQPVTGDEIIGVKNFRRWLDETLKEVQKQREQVLKDAK